MTPIGFQVKGQGQTADLWKNIFSTSLDSLALIANFGWVVASRDRCSLLIFRSKSNFWVDDPYWWSGHMVEGQGQHAGLWNNVFCSIFKTSIAC